MIHLRNLDFSYATPGFRLCVDELLIERGQRVAWSGPSGCGKTTLLNLVAGIMTPQSGEVVTCGVDLNVLGDNGRRDFRIQSIGLVFQEFELLDYLTVIDNVLLAYRINRSLHLTDGVRAAATSLLTEVGLTQLADRFPDQLSHGQRQRVAVCRALITSPQLILADEPTANLDEENKQRVVEMLEQHTAQTGATLVVVTHDADVRDRLERVIDISTYARLDAVAQGASLPNA